MQEAKQFVSLLAEAIEKGVFQLPNGSNERVQMYARGPFQSGERYQRGDVVSVPNGPIYICLEDTTSDPRSNSTAWLILQAIGYGGGYSTGGAVTPPAPAFNYVSFATGGGDGALAGFETITLTFDTAPNPATLPDPSDQYGATISGNWVVSGTSAVFTPNTTWMTLAGPYTLSTIGITGINGKMISAPQNIVIPVEYPAGAFALLTTTTGGGDGELFDLETVTLTFSGTEGAGAMPLWQDAMATTVAGSWMAIAGGVIFTPSSPWQSYTGPFFLDLVTHASGAGTPITNPQVVTLQLEGSVPTMQLFFMNLLVQSGAASIVGTRERLAAQFSEKVRPSSVVNTVVTRSDTGAVIPGAWAFFGQEAWFTPDAVWPNLTNATPAFIFSFNNVLSLDGTQTLTGADANGDFVREFSLASFALVSYNTGDGDYNIYDKETIILEFDSPPNLASFPQIYDGVGGVMIGNWTASGNTATFVPAIDWQDRQEPFILDTYSITGTNGAPNAMGLVVNLNLEWNFVKLTHSPASGAILANKDPLAVNFSSAGITSFPFVIENGVPKNGTWATFGVPTQVRFIPTDNWGSNALVVLNWSTAIAAGVNVSNPGSQSYNTADTFNFTGVAWPGEIGFLGQSSQIRLNFDKPVDISNMPLPYLVSTSAPVAGSWASSGATAIFTPAAPTAVGGSIAVNYSAAISSSSLALSNPGIVTGQVVGGITYLSRLPGASYVIPIGGLDQIILTFDSPPLLSGLVNPVFLPDGGSVVQPVAGHWVVIGNTGVFAPASGYQRGTLYHSTAAVKNRAAEPALNSSSFFWFIDSP